MVNESAHKGVVMNKILIILLLNFTFSAAALDWKDVCRSSVSEVQTAIQNGADVNAREGIFDRTPLHRAARCGVPDIVQVLLKAPGVDINAKDSDGDTPLHKALKDTSFSYDEDEKDIEVVKRKILNNLKSALLLISAKADVNAQNNNLITPLYYAASYYVRKLGVSLEIELLKVVDALILAGADVKARNASRSTPLHYVASTPYIKIAQVLISAGADVNATSGKNRHGVEQTPFRSSLKHPEMVTFLISVGAKLHIQDLFRAFERDKLEVVQILLDSGMDINSRNDRGETLLHTIGYQDYQNARFLIAAEIDVNAQDNEGNTALHRITSCDRNHYSCNSGAPNMTRILVQADADVNAQNNDLETPLHAMFKKGESVYPAVFSILMQNEADINMQDKKDNTPYHLSLLRDRPMGQMDQMFVDAGADIHIQNNDGITPAQLISEKEGEVYDWIEGIGLTKRDELAEAVE